MRQERLYKVKPTAGHMLVRRVEEELSRGGIIKPKVVQDSKSMMDMPVWMVEILAIGPTPELHGEAQAMAPEVKVGDLALFPARFSIEVTHKGETCYIIGHHDVRGVLEEMPEDGEPKLTPILSTAEAEA